MFITKFLKLDQVFLAGFVLCSRGRFYRSKAGKAAKPRSMKITVSEPKFVIPALKWYQRHPSTLWFSECMIATKGSQPANQFRSATINWTFWDSHNTSLFQKSVSREGSETTESFSRAQIIASRMGLQVCDCSILFKLGSRTLEHQIWFDFSWNGL